MSDIPIQIVDENDNPIGAAPKERAWAEGLIHRIVRLMILDGKGSVLLQKRALTKKLFPGRWDNSTAGHVDEGESYDEAIVRELKEELGLENQAIEKLGHFYVDENWEGLRMKNFVHVYCVTLPGIDKRVILNPGEVVEVRWMPIAEAKQLLKDHPEQFTYGVAQAVERYL